MVDAVCFDLDGTLIDSTDAIVDSFLHTFRTLKIPEPTRQRIIETISVPLEQQFAKLSVDDTDRATQIYREHYRAEAPAKTTLLPGANSAISQLSDAGLKLAIATSKRRSAAEPLLEYLGVLSAFEFCIGPEDVRHPKPHPECLLLAMDRLQTKPESMIFVGDSQYDIRAANAANVQCIALTTGYSTAEELQEHQPTVVLNNLHEVTRFVLPA